MNDNLPSGTVTFLFTDIQGSTPLWEQAPAAMQIAIALHHHILRQAIESNGGYVTQIIGDAFQAAFRLASQALNAALAAQRALQAANWPEATGTLAVRMGIHTGPAELDPSGDAPYAVSHTLNRVARIMSCGFGGQILISQEAAFLSKRDLLEGITLKDLGEHHLKGMTQAERLYQVNAPDLPNSFPPLTAGATHPNNLPVQLTSFIGREQELDVVTQLVLNNRMVTLTGSGGTGKTRLSVRVARELLDRFPNGVWFAELAGLGDPELVARTVIAALGLQESASRSLLEQLQDYLREKQALIVLDNCEHMISETARISGALLQACPRLKFLASSREALGVSGETVYYVPTLAVPDPHSQLLFDDISQFPSVQLFAERAASAKPDFVLSETNVRSVAQICQRLDGIPLAIELAAARAGILGVDQIAARLDNRFRLLTGGSRVAMPRQQTLRASIDWSFSLLEKMERMLLLRLSVFYGGWTLEKAGEVCGFDGLDEFDIIDGLAQLANKSLILVETEADGSTRYRMLETIRQYANEKLLDSNESETVRDRHLAAYVRLAWKAEPHLRSHQQVQWFDRLQVEIDNLRSALAWALEGDVLEGLRLATAIFWFWHIRSYRVEGEQWLRRLIDWVDRQALDDESKLLLAEARVRQSMLLSASGDVGAHAFRIAEEAMAFAEELGEAGKPVQLIALYALRWVNDVRGEENKSRVFAEKGLALAEELDDRFMLAEFLRTMVNVADRVKAKKAAERSMVLRRELGDLDGLMWTNIGLAQHYFDSGDVTQSRLLAEESYRLAQEIKNRWGVVAAQCNYATILYKSGEMDEGIDLLEQALPLSYDLNEPHWTIFVINALGHTADLKNDWASCQTYFQQAIQLSRTNRLANAEVANSISLAEAARKNNDLGLARHYYQAAVEAGREQAGNFLEGVDTYASGWVATIDEQPALAKRQFSYAVTQFHRQGNFHEMAHALDVLAILSSSHPELAARLHGAADQFRPVYNNWGLMLFLQPIDVAVELAGEAAIGGDEYNRLYNEGHKLSAEQVLALITDDANEREWTA
jgi:predicted ATPase/class 3 adenylate cyclase